MDQIFPFDLTILLEEVRPWHDCDLMLSAYQVEVEVLSADRGQWAVNAVRYRAPSDGAWVRPASGDGLAMTLLAGVESDDGYKAIENAIASEIAERRNGGMRRAA